LGSFLERLGRPEEVLGRVRRRRRQRRLLHRRLRQPLGQGEQEKRNLADEAKVLRNVHFYKENKRIGIIWL